MVCVSELQNSQSSVDPLFGEHRLDLIDGHVPVSSNTRHESDIDDNISTSHELSAWVNHFV